MDDQFLKPVSDASALTAPLTKSILHCALEFTGLKNEFSGRLQQILYNVLQPIAIESRASQGPMIEVS